jgi:hypothetical protein
MSCEKDDGSTLEATEAKTPDATVTATAARTARFAFRATTILRNIARIKSTQDRVPDRVAHRADTRSSAAVAPYFVVER